MHEQQEQIDAGLRHLVRAGQPFPGFRARVLAASETRPVWVMLGGQEQWQRWGSWSWLSFS